jgi:hypothetical protein
MGSLNLDKVHYAIGYMDSAITDSLADLRKVYAEVGEDIPQVSMLLRLTISRLERAAEEARAAHDP